MENTGDYRNVFGLQGGQSLGGARQNYQVAGGVCQIDFAQYAVFLRRYQGKQIFLLQAGVKQVRQRMAFKIPAEAVPLLAAEAAQNGSHSLVGAKGI
jgi:hypothetical protein